MPHFRIGTQQPDGSVSRFRVTLGADVYAAIARYLRRTKRQPNMVYVACTTMTHPNGTPMAVMGYRLTWG